MTMIERTESGPQDATERKASAARRKAFRLAHDDDGCPMCGIHMLCLPTEIDHILPVELGGADDESNWQLLCIACHREKTKADMKRIRKAARIRRTLAGETPPKQRIRSAGFRKDPLR